MTQQPGKLVADELYMHRDAIGLLSVEHSSAIKAVLDRASDTARERANVVKLNRKTFRVSLLTYRDFFDDPFPALAESWIFEPGKNKPPSYRSYVDSLNPPILHRKELLLPPDHPSRPSFAEITRQAEELGLFDDTATIGFRLNWQRLVSSKGYRIEGSQFIPLGNSEQMSDEAWGEIPFSGAIQRHLTALSRNSLSAPVQLLARHGLLQKEWTFFDYGCGRGDDMAVLLANGHTVGGWDPHYAPDNPITGADAINLGFVINVIEDPAERVEALQRAFSLANNVLSVGVMLYANRSPGQPYRDGFLTSRNTFQKYFSQSEFKDYLEQALQQEAFLVGPGVAFVFADKELEQRFLANRYRSHDLAQRLLALAHVPHTRTERTLHLRKTEHRLQEAHPLLDQLWEVALELGRLPERDEVNFADSIDEKLGSLSKAHQLLTKHYDLKQLKAAAYTRTDDLRVFFAMQLFAKRSPYRSLETRLRRDIKAFFGDYRTAQAAGMRLLQNAANPEEIKPACQAASENGIGWLDAEHALHLHTSMVERLPAILRTFVGCGLILYGDLSEVQLVKIHSASGKLTLMQFEGFDVSPLPRLIKRVKINLRKLDFDLFEYGDEYVKPLLYNRSRYLNEDYPDFAEQQAFDEALSALSLFDSMGYGLPEQELFQQLELHRRCIVGFRILPSQSIPPLEQRCGDNFTYRDLIECGETQQRHNISNLPKNPESYNALFDLATQILDPVIDYFGAVRLTYGFCSPELGKHIKARVAPTLDQHACYEYNRAGKPICERGGAACDFIVDDEDMKEVAEWIIKNLPFDRLYFYGKHLPLHVSYTANPLGLAYVLKETESGRRYPAPFTSIP